MNGLISEERLTKNYEFREVYKKGRSLANRELVLYVLKRDDPLKRIGISISKKVGNAVRRNRLKRILREVFRLNRGKMKEGLDLVFIVRRGTRISNYKEMENHVLDLLKKARII